MGIMVNARANDYHATRHVLILKCKNVAKSYLDVILKRLLDEGLVQREKVSLGRKEVWGYKATNLGSEWWMNPTKKGSPRRSIKEIEYRTIPLEGTIESEGWVERWNEQVIMISDYTGLIIRKHMKGRGKGGKRLG